MMCRGLKEQLTQLAMSAGAQCVGYARAGVVTDDCADSFSRWLSEGRNGAMGYLANYPDIRRDPRLLLDDGVEAHTVMVCAFSYYHVEVQEPGAARFAMYAHGSDYHEVLRVRLQLVVEALVAQGHKARVCIDSAPLMERYWAVQAGVGFIGVNSQLILPGMGSYFFLAEIVTTADLEPDEPCTRSCGHCGRCVKACPGGAIGDDGSFDARRCLSYLTIEHRGDLPDCIGSEGELSARSLAEAMGERVYGCDECQRVCPHNCHPPQSQIDEFLLRPALKSITREDIMRMSQADFSRIFTHSAVKRAKLAGLQRNAKIGLKQKT